MGKTYTAEEIVRHNHSESLWIVIHGSVYDLTNFYRKHPGGEDVLLDLAGKDGTECFNSIGHSFEAITLRDTYKIGEMKRDMNLDGPDREAESESKESVEESQDEDWQAREQYEMEKEEKERKSFVPLIGVMVVIYAFIVYYVWF
ncbi:cytochrome b5 [Harpegnathos saltator]|uniref:Cytochrome b5 n=1 Tax=Harpegnathos saltator TaxID=610380 RepID=E2BM05_HARSA|nr:cytochrome b5 [Harpegnathos saltator]XP_025161054.1 cytochrome b5 [Harpegnathos saltator]XP_025161056.1 cytochrome b5 [Harpegnathos saltator]EFN83254.1 Cytochrome b5 [Harpegnathos saltator]